MAEKKPDTSDPKEALMKVNRWTTRQASAWSGLAHRTVIERALTGEIPAIVTGDQRDENMPSAKRKDGRRHRRCGSISIPRVAFIRWYESLAPKEPTASDAEMRAHPIRHAGGAQGRA